MPTYLCTFSCGFFDDYVYIHHNHYKLFEQCQYVCLSCFPFDELCVDAYKYIPINTFDNILKLKKLVIITFSGFGDQRPKLSNKNIIYTSSLRKLKNNIKEIVLIFGSFFKGEKLNVIDLSDFLNLEKIYVCDCENVILPLIKKGWMSSKYHHLSEYELFATKTTYELMLPFGYTVKLAHEIKKFDYSFFPIGLSLRKNNQELILPYGCVVEVVSDFNKLINLSHASFVAEDDDGRVFSY